MNKIIVMIIGALLMTGCAQRAQSQDYILALSALEDALAAVDTAADHRSYPELAEAGQQLLIVASEVKDLKSGDEYTDDLWTKALASYGIAGAAMMEGDHDMANRWLIEGKMAMADFSDEVMG